MSYSKSRDLMTDAQIRKSNTTQITEEWARVNSLAYLDGYAVQPRVIEFMDALKKANKAYRFKLTDTCSNAWVSGKTVFSEVAVYREGDDYAMGYIGINRFKTDGEGNRMFMVTSRTVINNQYSGWNLDHHQVMTKNITTAVRNAKKYLVPYTSHEIAGISKRDFAVNVTLEQNRANRAEIEAYGRLQGMTHDLIDELTRFMQKGYEFNSMKVVEALSKYHVVKEEKEWEMGKTFSAYHVRIYKRFDKDWADITLYTQFGGSGGTNIGVPAETKTILASEIPEDIAGGIAVMSMLEGNAYVDGVGQKVDTNQYWITKHEQTQSA